jgi:hypothetical protein
VLGVPPMTWETPTLEEVGYTPELRNLYAAAIRDKAA